MTNFEPVLRDEWLEEMFFLCSFQPQIVRMSSEAEDFGTLERGMKAVLLGGQINKQTPTATEYTIVMDFTPFMEYNINLSIQWYQKNKPTYDFEKNLPYLRKQLEHQRYGISMWGNWSYRSIFDKRFKPIPYNIPTTD